MEVNLSQLPPSLNHPWRPVDFSQPRASLGEIHLYGRKDDLLSTFVQPMAEKDPAKVLEGFGKSSLRASVFSMQVMQPSSAFWCPLNSVCISSWARGKRIFLYVTFWPLQGPKCFRTCELLIPSIGHIFVAS